jgi:hypothetical protein
MAEEKDAAELEAEKSEGEELPALPPIPQQIMPTDGQMRPTQRPPGEWLREHGLTAPPGSFTGEGLPVTRASAPRARATAPEVESVRVLRSAPVRRRTTTATAKKTAAKQADATKAASKKTTVRRTAGTRSTSDGSTSGRASRRRSS